MAWSLLPGATPIITLGLVHRNSGLAPTAVRLREKALALDPDPKGDRNQLAKCGKLRNYRGNHSAAASYKSRMRGIY